MSLTITEAWIRERVQLTHDNLEDVRSLSLPGTYQEKISSLGNALTSFSRLKQIDLSRNGLQSLQGLQHNKLLEKLNLYYNNISSLQELKRLRHNPALQEIDLRLNPVTKNEPDYRLYLVHMLPNLRKLDDRSVRESERKSALLHFDSDQATSMTEHATSPSRDSVREELPRTKHVRGLGGRTAIEEDDSDLLDLLARTDGDLTRPRPVTGSTTANPAVDIQLAQDYQRPYSQRTSPRRRAGSNASSHMTDTDKQSLDLSIENLPVMDTSTASESTGSLLDADPLDNFNDSNPSVEISPLRSPGSLHSHDILTLRTDIHTNLPSPTDTNNLVDDHEVFPSDIWQPSDSLLEERHAFDAEHKDLLSPTDTNSLIDADSGPKFGKARLSFSPVDRGRKLDFDAPSEESSVVGNHDDILSVQSSLSMSSAGQSQRHVADQDFDMQSGISATPRGTRLIKAGDIYSSIMSQTRNSRARTKGKIGSTSPGRIPGPLSGSTGSHLSSPSRNTGTHLVSPRRIPSPHSVPSNRNAHTNTRPLSPSISLTKVLDSDRSTSQNRLLSPSTSPTRTAAIYDRPRSPTKPLSPSTSPTKVSAYSRPRNSAGSPERISSYDKHTDLARPLSPKHPKRPSYSSSSSTNTLIYDRPQSPTRSLSPQNLTRQVVYDSPGSPMSRPTKTFEHGRSKSPTRPISPTRSLSPSTRPTRTPDHGRSTSSSKPLSSSTYPSRTRPISPTRTISHQSPPTSSVHGRPISPQPPFSNQIRTSCYNRSTSPTQPLSVTSPMQTWDLNKPQSTARSFSPPSIHTEEQVLSRPQSPTRSLFSTSSTRLESPHRSRDPTLFPTSRPQKNLDQTLGPRSPQNASNPRHLTSVLKSPGTSIESSPLSKESKKSVTFMLGGVHNSNTQQNDNTKWDLLASPGRTLDRQLRDVGQSVEKDLWNSSLNKNNSNANEDSLIHTSALLRTPEENRYSNLVIGRDRDDSLGEPGNLKRDIRTELFGNMERKLEGRKSDLSKKDPVRSTGRIQANSYNFSLHNDNEDTDHKSRRPLHVSSDSPLTPSRHIITNLFSPTHSNHSVHGPVSLSASLHVSPNPTDSVTCTISPSTTNKRQGLVSNRPRSSSSDTSTSDDSQPGHHQTGALSEFSPHHVHHLLTPAPEPSQHLSDPERSQQYRSRVNITEQEPVVRGPVDSNLKFTDESDAYAEYSSKVNFTPNPKSRSRSDSSSTYDLHPVSGPGEMFDEPPPVQRSIKQSEAQGMSASTFMDTLLNLVDRYWNGSKSLHAHSKFQAQAKSLLEKLLTSHSSTSQEHMDRLQLDVARYAQENVSLRNKLSAAGGGRGQPVLSVAGPEIQRALDKAQKDVDMLRLELQEVTEENRQLQVQLQASRRKAADASSITDAKESSQGYEKLQQENEKLRVQLKHVSQLQELATMLQESHKSLVTTNDHLLKELEETKQRHMEEVKQLHWSYNQMKQTMDITTSAMPLSHHTPSKTTHANPPQGGTVNGYDRGEESPPPQPGYGSYSPGRRVKGFSYSNGSM